MLPAVGMLEEPSRMEQAVKPIEPGNRTRASRNQKRQSYLRSSSDGSCSRIRIDSGAMPPERTRMRSRRERICSPRCRALSDRGGLPIFLNLVIGTPAAEPGDGQTGSEIAGQQYCVDQDKTDGQRQERIRARPDHAWPRRTRLRNIRSARVQRVYLDAYFLAWSAEGQARSLPRMAPSTWVQVPPRMATVDGVQPQLPGTKCQF